MNNIRLFGFITPFIYIHVIIKMPLNINRMYSVIIGFLLGLTVDIFSNTFGMHAAAATFTGFMRLPLLKAMFDLREMPEDSIPSYNLFGFTKFAQYAFSLAVIHIVTLYLTEAFTLFEPLYMLVRISSGIILTCLLIFIIEAFNTGKSKSG
jgi:rod shape-determining protein MreD